MCHFREVSNPKMFVSLFILTLYPSLLTLYSLPLRQLFYEPRGFHFLNKTLIDESLRVRRGGLAVFRSHVIEQRLYAGRIGIRHVQQYRRVVL